MTENTATQNQSTGAPPGTSFYAPAVHLLEEDATGLEFLDSAILIPSAESGTGHEHPVHSDVERAEVVQVNHGPSQMSVTLNNQRHERGVDPRPISPSWKYNRLDYVRFGQKMVVKFGYALMQPGSIDSLFAPSSEETEFQKNLMLRARITDMTFTFPNQGGSKMALKGEDAISLLNAKPTEDKRYDRKNEVQMVEDVLTRSQSGLSLASGPRETVSGTIRSLTHSKGQSYWQFIDELAKRLDYEIWIDIDESDQIHFEKSRSLDLGPTIDLSWNKNLIDFKPKFKGWDTYTGATSGGRNPSQRRAIREVVAATEIQSDLHTAPDGSAPITAIDARNRFFSGEGGSSDNNVTINVNNLDSGRARLAAVAELRRSARAFLTADATTIGLPHLRPGMHVNIQKLYAPFDGIYYVTQATHTIDQTGYKTKVELAAPRNAGSGRLSDASIGKPIMSYSPFAQILDSFDEDSFGNRVAGLRYAEVESIGEDGYVLNWLTSDADAPSSPARCASLMAGNERGAWFRPEPGDEVLVGFEGGDLDRPVIIGSLWSDVDAPPGTADTSESNNIRSIVSRLGHQLTFDDTAGSGKVTLKTADEFMLEMDDAAKKITLSTPGGIKLQFEDQPPKITLQLDDASFIEISADGVTVKGAKIDLNPP